MEPLEVVERWQERGWGDGDLNAVDELVAERFVRHDRSGTSTRTRAELKDDLRQYQRGLHKPTVTVHDRVVSGDRVWSRVTMRGCNLDTGDERTLDVMQIHRVEDGLIVEAWTLTASDSNWD